MLPSYLAVMSGGALGVGARLWVSHVMASRYGESFPLGTLLVNVLGCLAIGIVSALTGSDGFFFTSPLTRQVIMVGFLGGFTTFSAFSLQTIQLMNDGQWLYAGLNITLSVGLCLLAVWVGLTTTALISAR
ncbi:MAG: fluoride efflux transporter CrcB [Blastochloris sp.]|nr:fluoride efflux transporter CrcB [Blastochloris sp.]